LTRQGTFWEKVPWNFKNFDNGFWWVGSKTLSINNLCVKFFCFFSVGATGTNEIWAGSKTLSINSPCAEGLLLLFLQEKKRKSLHKLTKECYNGKL